MRKIKKLILGVIGGLFAIGLFFGFTQTAKAAVTPNWDLTGTWKIDFALDGGGYDSNLYDLTLTQTSSNLIGVGQYPSPGPYTYAWNATGSINGNTFTLVDTYTLGAVGTTMNMTGTVASDGTLSGTWNDNYLGYRSGTWKTISGWATPTSFDWGSQVNSSLCQTGNLVINITQKVNHDVDSAVGGGIWAWDTYNRLIKVWQVSDRQFCAVVSYSGSFNTIGGKSPAGAGPIVAGIVGTMNGGYRSSIFTGALLPDTQRRGNIGTFDYGCTLEDSGNHETCTTAFSWLKTYFGSVPSDFSQDWWGWVYTSIDHGTWINSIVGNYGDIH